MMVRQSPPVVSVIIPTFNRGRFIASAIHSVLAQSYEHFEVIVVDDGSTDDTKSIVAEITDERVHYIYQSNHGRSNARNHALKVAQGKYIAFLDSDDLYMPGKLAMQIEYLDAHSEVGMIYTSAVCVDEAGNRLSHTYEATVSGDIYKHIAFFTPVTITLPTVVVRAEVFSTVGGFDENMHRFEDTDMWRRISKQYKIDALSLYTCELRTHDDNALLAQDPNKIALGLKYYVQKIFREDRNLGTNLLRRGAARIYFYYGGALFKVPQWRMFGVRLLISSFCYSPFGFMRSALGQVRRSVMQFFQ
jgi:glycosyltransferase involved in cell wall biosynthesis